MRILVVSAHYPPDFVSGGTIQPQRLARGLQTRGHDVSVFAGHLDRGHQPLTEWDEIGDDHIPVHWITTWPFTEWRDQRSWDNRDVARAFAVRLAIDQPQLVHIHSLQGLGI